MFEGAFSPMHWLLVLAIVLVLFGPRRLPEIGKSLGQAIRGFKDAMSSDHDQPVRTEPPADDKPAKPGA